MTRQGRVSKTVKLTRQQRVAKRNNTRVKLTREQRAAKRDSTTVNLTRKQRAAKRDSTMVKLTRKQRAAKRKLYFDVEKIIDHRDCLGDRDFLIKWKNYTTPTWEPENNLDGCLRMLKDYCTAHDIEYTEMEAFVGGDQTTDKLNHNNFVKISEVEKTLKTYLEQIKLTTTLNIITYKESVPDEDSIILMAYESHCYVILYYAGKHLGYIADGANLFIEDAELANELTEELDIALVGRKFEQQLGLDHCASSAVMIATELIRHYQYNIKPDKIIITHKQRLQRLTKNFHKEKSVKLNDKPLHEFRIQFICNVCGKRFNRSNGKGYKIHIAKHN